MFRYRDLPRSSWGHPWHRTICVVTVDDGTFGIGMTVHAGPVEQIINGHFASVLRGQDCTTPRCAASVP